MIARTDQAQYTQHNNAARNIRVSARRRRPVDYTEIASNQLRRWNDEYQLNTGILENDRFFIVVEEVPKYADQVIEESEWLIRTLDPDSKFKGVFPAHTILMYSEEISDEGATGSTQSDS